jgi:hypothetical protein
MAQFQMIRHSGLGGNALVRNVTPSFSNREAGTTKVKVVRQTGLGGTVLMRDLADIPHASCARVGAPAMNSLIGLARVPQAV